MKMCDLVKPAVLVMAGLWLAAMSMPVRGELVTGNGEWESRSSVAIRGTWTVALDRSGSDVKGTVTLTGSPLFSGAEVTGTMDGDVLMFGTVVELGKQVTFSGTLSDEQITGEWQCDAINDSGSWSGTLRSAAKRESAH